MQKVSLDSRSEELNWSSRINKMKRSNDASFLLSFLAPYEEDIDDSLSEYLVK